MSKSKISGDSFHHIAKLSRLSLKPEDEIIASQLSQAADYVDVLNELDITKVKPTFQVNHKQNVFREDIVQPSFTQSVAISAAPKSQDGYFVTTATIKK